MQSGQVSVWVPIVVGVIGLVGVIAGQLVSAWREDRRWRREQVREDMRWARENKRESVKLDRDTKSLIFGQLLQALNRSHSLLDRLRDLSGKESTKGATSEYLKNIDEIRAKVAEVQLICSADMHRLFSEGMPDMWLLPAMMYGINVKDPRAGESAGNLTPKEAMERISRFPGKFLRLARDELVIDDGNSISVKP
ncbi:hypothetical protein [Amycolatopsis magusensis]|uniref:hypothetical protein n=1 Tax=Amycolatopsis magusensis TaxID=882444 RepID=UPI0024A7C80A|nr:hypothetical protein [Amycolatopsis magusensis]MDI5979851.1 hypothetical protein [Amycolatopsis magusensis]